VRSGFASGTAQIKDLEQFGDSKKRGTAQGTGIGRLADGKKRDAAKMAPRKGAAPGMRLKWTRRQGVTT
jgi:hypothetical protein